MREQLIDLIQEMELLAKQAREAGIEYAATSYDDDCWESDARSAEWQFGYAVGVENFSLKLRRLIKEAAK